MIIGNDTPAMADILSGTRPKPINYRDLPPFGRFNLWLATAPVAEHFHFGANPVIFDIDENYLLAHPLPHNVFEMLVQCREAGLSILINGTTVSVAANEDGTRFAEINHNLLTELAESGD